MYICNNLYMSKFKLVNTFDNLFIVLSIFLISYAWINFYLHSLWLSFFLILIFTGSICVVLHFFLSKKNNKKILTNKTLKEIETNFFAFQLMSQKNQVLLIKSTLKDCKNILTFNNFLTYEKDNKKHLLTLDVLSPTTDDKLIKILSDFADADFDVLEIVNLKNETTIPLNILKEKTIKFIDKSSLYSNHFLPAQKYPNKTQINYSESKLKFNEILKNFLQRKKAKSYFLCGIILLFSSLIFPFSAYYVVMGSTLLFFSIMCIIYPKFKK